MFQGFSGQNPLLAAIATRIDRPTLECQTSQQNTIRESSAYNGTEIQDFRRALRLSAKLHRTIDDVPAGAPEVFHYHDEGLTRTSQAAECALILTLAREPRDVVVAGALFNALEGVRGADLTRRKAAIRHKFGDRVVQLIELGDEFRSGTSPFKCEGRYGLLRQRLNQENRSEILADTTSLAAAAMAAEGRFIGGKELIIMVAAANVPPVVVHELLRQSPELGRHECAQVIREQMKVLEPSLAYSSCEIECIRRSAKLSLEIFRDALRAWGQHEELPLAVHDFEVGLMLAAAGSNADTIEAGLMHDGLEEYIGIPLGRVYQLISMHASERTLELVNQQTEPPKRVTEANFWARKMPVMQALLDGDRDLAELIVAAKTSTLSFGNKHVRVTHDCKGWSQGTFAENVDLYQLYHAAGEKMGVAKPLLDALQAEINQFVSLGERFDLFRQDPHTDVEVMA